MSIFFHYPFNVWSAVILVSLVITQSDISYLIISNIFSFFLWATIRALTILYLFEKLNCWICWFSWKLVCSLFHSFLLSFPTVLVQRLAVSFLCHHDNFLTIANDYKLLVFKPVFHITSQVFYLKQKWKHDGALIKCVLSSRLPQDKAKGHRLHTNPPWRCHNLSFIL